MTPPLDMAAAQRAEQALAEERAKREHLERLLVQLQVESAAERERSRALAVAIVANRDAKGERAATEMAVAGCDCEWCETYRHMMRLVAHLAPTPPTTENEQ